MELIGLAIVAIFIILFGAISERINGTIITAPIIFVVFGLIIGKMGFGLVEIELENEILGLLAEITLVLVLFADASRIDFSLLRQEQDLPIRMLTIGLILTMLSGTLIGLWLFADLTLWQAAILAVILTPTDAALAQAIVTSPLIPVRIRQSINVESGLNDGLALPVLILVLTLAGANTIADTPLDVLPLAASQLILGPIIGAIIAYSGGELIRWSYNHGWITTPFLRLSALGLAVSSFAVAELLGGNGFIAAFVAGLTMGTTARDICTQLYESAETEGQFLTMLTFIAFGAIMLPEGLRHLSPSIFLYALLSLTVVRMIPVAISLIGKSLCWETIVFFGWFGPRGIASIIYILIVLNRAQLQDAEIILHITAITVGLSILLHGLSATLLTRWYNNRIHTREDDMMEMIDVVEMPTR